MKKVLRLSTAMLALGAGSLTLMSSWNGPGVGASGSPVEGGATCANAYCHGGTANTGSGSVTITPPSAYAAGNTYTVNVKVSDPSSSKFGFQAIALDANNNPVGTFTANGSTRILKTGTASYIEHNGNDFSGTFSFQWTAPASDVGDITFYVAGNATNGDGKTTGDNVYTSTAKSSFTTSIGEPQSIDISVYPNPVADWATIEIEESESYNYSIIAQDGRMVLNASNLRGDSKIDLSSFENGIYVLHISGKDFTAVENIVVSH